MSSQLAWEVIPTPRISTPPRDSPPLPKQKPQQNKNINANPTNPMTKSDLMFIKDLNPTEKSKIALMIQQVSKSWDNFCSFNYWTTSLRLQICDINLMFFFQIVKLEQTCTEFQEDLDRMTNKYNEWVNMSALLLAFKNLLSSFCIGVLCQAMVILM